MRVAIHCALALGVTTASFSAFAAEAAKKAAPAKAAKPAAAKPAPEKAAKPAAAKPAADKPAAEKTAKPAAQKGAKPAADKTAPAKGSSKKGGKGSKAAAKQEAAPEKTIWTYRTHYQFNGENINLDVAQDNGEWRLYQGESDIIADPIGFEVELADGTKLSNAQMVLETSLREVAEDPKFGPGTKYENVFKPVGDIRISQRVMKFNERPFLMVRLIVENLGKGPVAIKRMAPFFVAPGVLTGFSPDVDVHTHHVVERGGFAVRDAAHPAVMTRFLDKKRNSLLLVGIVSAGRGDASCEFKKDGNSWAGGAQDIFSPALSLAAGAKTESDAACLCFNSTSTDFVDQYYSWALFTSLRHATVAEGPETWSTAEPGESFETLKANADAWRKYNVKHVLVRAGTKGKFEKIKQDLGRGFEVGSEIDPLDGDGENADWTIAGPDGRHWLNPTLEGAKNYLKKRVERLASNDCAFIVVGKTAAPDEVFAKIGLPREQVVQLASDAIESGAGKIFLYGAPALAPDASPDALAEVFREVNGLAVFGAWPTPIELKFSSDPGKSLAAALKVWRAPIALSGKPNS